MRTIVTGASGFVGRAVCAELTARGHDVTAVVRKNDPTISASRVICCEMSDYERLDAIITERCFDVLYHFAWTGTSGEERSNYDIQLNNVRFSCAIAEQCAKLQCKKFVYAASIMEYEVNALMETGGMPAASTLYSSAKLAADYMSRAVSAANNVEYIRAVISNIYGAGEKSQRLINTSIHKLLKGEHCSFSAGEQMYDFVYISDAAKIFAEIGEKGVPFKTYYVGSGKPQKLKYFLKEMRDAVAPTAELGLGEIPFNGVSLDYNLFDINAVFNDTGFEPEIPFKDGIMKTAEWIRKDN